jgi:RNase P subunit RPR2
MDKIKRVLTKKCSSPLTPAITVPVNPVDSSSFCDETHEHLFDFRQLQAK